MNLATGSILLGGMILPGKGSPESASLIGSAPEKFPTRSSAVAGNAVLSRSSRMRWPW